MTALDQIGATSARELVVASDTSVSIIGLLEHEDLTAVQFRSPAPKTGARPLNATGPHVGAPFLQNWYCAVTSLFSRLARDSTSRT